MNKIITAATLAAACLAATAIPGAAAPGKTTASENRQLAEVRAATVAYRDVEAAEAAGYESTEECVPGMGIHYVNWSLVFDPTLDHRQPEVLLYQPTKAGVRLIAVEWFKLDEDGSEETVEVLPLFDRHLHGPMTHGLPLHYDLHAWVWQGNPDGVFADYNPNVHCAE